MKLSYLLCNVSYYYHCLFIHCFIFALLNIIVQKEFDKHKTHQCKGVEINIKNQLIDELIFVYSLIKLVLDVTTYFNY